MTTELLEKKELFLPTEDYVPNIVGIPDDFAMVIFGAPKIGKTSLSAEFPKSLLLECEPGGAKYIQCRKMDINSLGDLRKAYDLLKDDTTYETITLDTLDRIAQWVEEEICAEMGLKSILDPIKNARMGSQWGEYTNRVMAIIHAWKSLKKRVIFLAHTKKAEVDGGFVISPKTINLYGQCASRVLQIVENIGNLYAVEDEKGNVVRRLSFKAGIHVEAGSNHPAITDKVIDLPKGKGYEAFAALFGKKKKGA